jgi:BirA family biotin operon repressor/biotin-[acetyl-CoA-carboxylase] ligase
MNESSFVEQTTKVLRTLPFVKTPVVFDDVDSTNAEAKKLAEGDLQEGTVIVARIQHEGRGRFDRNWESPEGGVYLSLILQPKAPLEKISLLSLLTALTVTKTIHTYGVHATIKWPNDVRIKDRKIAGILLESIGNNQKIDYVITGVGINLTTDLTKFSTAIQAKSTSLLNELHQTVNYHGFLKTFFKIFDELYQVFQTQHYDEIINQWKALTDTLGKNVRVVTSTETLEGTAVDIDSSGFLLLKTTEGETKKILSGDCLYFDESHHA